MIIDDPIVSATRLHTYFELTNHWYLETGYDTIQCSTYRIDVAHIPRSECEISRACQESGATTLLASEDTYYIYVCIEQY